MPNYQTKAYNNVKPLPLPISAIPQWVAVDVEFRSVNYAINDLIELCELPIGHKVLDWFINFPDIDSNGTPTWAMSLGIENALGNDLGAEVWATGLTAGQSNALVRNTTSVSAQGDIANNRKLALKVTAAAATYAGAAKTGQVMLLMQA